MIGQSMDGCVNRNQSFQNRISRTDSSANAPRQPQLSAMTPCSSWIKLRKVRWPHTITTLGLILLCSLTITHITAARPNLDDYDDTIQSAFNSVEWSQQNVTTDYNFPFSLQKFEGIYPSRIHLNFVGSPFMQLLRNGFGVFDNNQFVTNWVLQLLLESSKFGIVQLDDAIILKGLNLTIGFKELDDDDETGTQDFWKEVLMNGTYQQYPINIAAPIQDYVEPIGNLLNLWCETSPSVCPKLQPIIDVINNLSNALAAFGIPADFDDSGVNLALGALLSQQQDSLPDSWALWSGATWNQSPKKLLEKYVEAAYRPFSTDFDQNSIDPRTYYWIRTFIAQEQERFKAAGTEPSLLLITTWDDNITNSDLHFYDHHSMPFVTNNVDGSVVGNGVFGILSSIVMHAPADGSGDYQSFVTSDLLQLLQDSSRLLAYVVNSEILLTRNDLVLLYYPPVHDFYYFAARSLRLLESTDINLIFNQTYGDATTAAALQTMLDTLSSALRVQGTATLSKQAQHSISPNTSSAYAYWDEFLGNGDVDDKNQSTPHYDDRLFSTAIATNALIATWTIETDSAGGPPTLNWVDGVTADVQELILDSCTFLNEQLVSGLYQPDNTFFSGSVKGHTTLPFFYPINLWRYINGTVIPPESVTFDDVDATLGVSFSGVVSESDYQYLMENNPLGVTTPTTFAGYNVDGNGMVYWSSPPLTLAAGMLALGQCQTLNQLLAQ